MRTNRSYGLMTRLAVEGIEANATAPGEEVVAAPVEAGADSLEADLVEVNSDVVELQDGEAGTEEAAEVVEEMEEAAVALESIAANGGLDRNGARMWNLYAASLNRRVGLPENHKLLSVESFGGTADRVSTTRLAAESIADKAKELWAKIVEMFRSAIAAIVAVWNRLFDGATKMKARAEKLYKAATDNKATDKKENFENQKLAENLHQGGTVDAKKAAQAVLDETSVLTTITKASIQFAGQASQMIEAGDIGMLTQLTQTIHGAANSGFTKVGDAASVGMGNPGEGLELMRGDELPGNKAVIAIVPTAGAKPDALGKVGFKLGIFDASKKVADKAQLATLATGDIQAIAKTIQQAADHLLSYKSAQKEAEAAAKKVIALAEKKAKETVRAEAGADAGIVDKAKAAGKALLAGSDERAIAKGAMNSVVNSAPPLAAFALNAGGYVLQYGEQSLKQYGAAKTEEKPAAAAAAAPAKAAA
jgi:hypothetical protein